MYIDDKYISPLGYTVDDDNGVDSYGVDHSGFSLRDELEYQNARIERENQMIQNYNHQGIKENYPKAGKDFWGNSENNYGFGTSNITENIENVANRLKNNGGLNGRQEQQEAFEPAHKKENDWLMNGMDTLYGMNRTLNGMTFGGLDWLGDKFGFDSQMNEYLNLKDDESRDLTQMAGNAAEFGGAALTGGQLAQAGYNQANMAYNGYKIGKAYDKLKDKPFTGSGKDVIARMKNHNGEPVVLQRGEAMLDKDGRVIASGGSEFKRLTGTKSNYGLNKAIYKHDVPRSKVVQLPKILKRKPFEQNQYGQNIYLWEAPDGTFRIVTSPKDDVNILSSIYKIEK